MKRHNSDKRGFTIVELMIAISIFSVILLVCLSAIIYVGRIYYKGVSNARTQEVARTTIDEISDAIKFSSQPVYSVTGASGWTGAYCIGSKKFSYKENIVLAKNPSGATQSNETFVLSTDPACGATGVSPIPVNDPANPKKELLSEMMRVVSFTLNQNASTGITTVSITVAYGGNGTATDSDIFNYTAGRISSCKSGNAGAQFCSVNSLTKTLNGAR